MRVVTWSVPVWMYLSWLTLSFFSFYLLRLHESMTHLIDSDFFIAMSSSDSDVAASDLSLAARELDERLQEPTSTPPAFETTASAGKGKGKGKGKRGKKAVEGQLTEDQKQDAIDFFCGRGPTFIIGVTPIIKMQPSGTGNGRSSLTSWECPSQSSRVGTVACGPCWDGRRRPRQRVDQQMFVFLGPRSMCGRTCSSWCPTSVRFHLTPWAPGRRRQLLNLMSSLSLRLNSILTSLLQVGWRLDMLASTLQSVHDASATAPL